MRDENDKDPIIRSTRCMEGNYPEWNETLEIPLKPQGMVFTTDELSESEAVLYISMYDRVVRKE